jgi:hypothetical protein
MCRGHLQNITADSRGIEKACARILRLVAATRRPSTPTTREDGQGIQRQTRTGPEADRSLENYLQ